MQTTNPETAANRITGSASMKIGIVPDVSVTIVDENRTRQVPDVNITKPVWSFYFIRPTIYANRQADAPIRIYNSSIHRGIVPPAFP